MDFVGGPDGQIAERRTKVGRVVSWQPRERILFELRQADWKPDDKAKLEMRFEPFPNGTRLTLDYQEWEHLLDDPGGELAGWFAGEVVAPLFRRIGPRRFGGWLTDRKARGPSGERSRGTYRDPLYHHPNVRAKLLDETP